MDNIKMLFTFVGGLGMFLYGMHIMAAGLEKSAGNRMKKLLGILTNNRFLAVIVGAIVTAIIQSSSATTVMVVGFVNAGIVNLTQAVGVIMGANIGTTITAWMVSISEWGAFLKPEFIAPLIIGIGAFMILFAKSERKRELAEIAVGFGILFIGLSFMSDAIKPYREAPIFTTAFETLGHNPFLGILAGAVVTAIIQSSSASVGILQTLAMNGVVGWNSAVFITLGQNIGTCITALLSGIGANRTAKRAAIIHLLFNVTGAVLFGVVMFGLFMWRPSWANSSINSVQISIFHTIFNITNTCLLFPFANRLVRISGAIVKEDAVMEKEEEEEVTLRHLDERILESPSFAVENVILEVVHMGEVAKQSVLTAFDAMIENDQNRCETVLKTEDTIDNMAQLITEYLVKINNLNLNEKQHHIINNLFYTVSNLERIGDHAENIADLAKFKIENKIEFSDTAKNELKDLIKPVSKSLVAAVNARKDSNLEEARLAKEFEKEVDVLEEQLREQHLDRLSNNACTSTAGVVFLDVLTNLERISDHADNIADYVLTEGN